MKLASQPLTDFIEGFHIPVSEITCFNATIVFTTKFKSIQLETPVEINKSSIKGMSVIYFLNPGINEHGIPDIIYENEEIWSYFPGSYLKVKGRIFHSLEYSLLIHPEIEPCSDATLMEIKQRVNN